MFEHSSQPIISRRAFVGRLATSIGVSLGLIVVSLFLGMLGYHELERLNWIDSFLNAAMLLGGMGPVNSPVTFAGKLFAGCYSLYCGLLVIFVSGIILAPVAHRILHRFHIQKDES